MRPTPWPVGRLGGRSGLARIISSSRSTSASTSTGSLVPNRLNSLIPLSPNGLCEAETMAPGCPRTWATVATPGVGRTPRSMTSAPSVARPADSAAWSSGPDRRVSRPTTKAGVGSTRATARPSASASSAVSSSLATPRTPSVPKRAGATGSALGVLGRLAGLLEAVLLGLLLPCVTGEETRPLEHRAVLGVDLAEAAGNAEAHGAGLARDTAPVDGGVDVVGLSGVGHPQRLGQEHAVRGRGEVGIERLLVDRDGALAGAKADAGHGLLAASGGLAEWCGHRVLLSVTASESVCQPARATRR